MAAGDLTNIFSGSFTKTTSIHYGKSDGTLGNIKEVYVGHNGEAVLLWKLSDPTPSASLEWGANGAIAEYIPSTNVDVTYLGMCVDTEYHDSIFTNIFHDSGIVVGFTEEFYDLGDKEMSDGSTGHIITVKFTNAVHLIAGQKYYISFIPRKWDNAGPKFGKYTTGTGNYVTGILMNNFTPVVIDVSPYNYRGIFNRDNYTTEAATIALFTDYQENDLIRYQGRVIEDFGLENAAYYRNSNSVGTFNSLKDGTLGDAYNTLATMAIGDTFINNPPANMSMGLRENYVYQKTANAISGKTYRGTFFNSDYSDAYDGVNALVSMDANECVAWGSAPYYWPFSIGSQGSYYIRNSKNPYGGASSSEPTDVVGGNLYYKTSDNTVKWNGQALDKGFYASDGTTWTSIDVTTLFTTAEMKADFNGCGVGEFFTRLTNNEYLFTGTYNTDAKFYIEINRREVIR